jgi:16S rRNA (cytidine1402-2'-O)-methyltransferase
MGTLYLVSTPIGNLGDLTRRAAETLGSVSRVLAEDTRRTRKLLSHLGISTPLVSLHAHNEASREGAILGWLAGGEDLAMVSDAGTPLVSDPGRRVVAAVLGAGHTVVPIPGPSAVLAALVASGLPSDRFSFLGFLPRKGPERAELLERIAASPDTTVLFESPGRTCALLEALLGVCGPDRRAAVARELTKVHEEILRGTLGELAARFAGEAPRGEVTVVVEAAPEEDDTAGADDAAARALAQALLEEGMAPSRVAREVAKRLKLPRNLAYRAVQELAGKAPPGEGREGEVEP